MKKFVPLSVSSKFAICGLPIRMDTYKYCTFGCEYCFANCREIMSFEKKIVGADIGWLERKLKKVIGNKDVKSSDFLEVLISGGLTFHCGGMADPFQPCEGEMRYTEKAVDICNKYERDILFSTKADTVYKTNIRPDRHSFQFSITGAGADIEKNVPPLEKRVKFYRELKKEGFRVGIRLQPFIPGITTLDIVEMFRDADNFTIEGIKLVPQNEEHKKIICEKLGLDMDDFIQRGLLCLKPLLRLKAYGELIERLKYYGVPYSVADNDLRQLGTNFCCCGDHLVRASSGFDTTAMIKKYGVDYAKEQIDEELYEAGVRDCKCNHLFTSNRQEGCVSVQDFYDKRFYRKTSPFSPEYIYRGAEI